MKRFHIQTEFKKKRRKKIQQRVDERYQRIYLRYSENSKGKKTQRKTDPCFLVKCLNPSDRKF